MSDEPIDLDAKRRYFAEVATRLNALMLEFDSERSSVIKEKLRAEYPNLSDDDFQRALRVMVDQATARHKTQ